MPSMLAIVQHTPLWVFALLAVLVVLGVQSLRRRTLPTWRMLLVPLVFIAWGLITLAVRAAVAPILIVDWLVLGGAGFALGWITTRLEAMTVHPGRRTVDVPGSPVPLIRNLVIFAAKYGLAASVAIAPAHQASLFLWDVGVSGLTAGYFIGWLARFALKLQGAPASPTHQPDSALPATGGKR